MYSVVPHKESRNAEARGQDRRSRRRMFRLNERRTGFDRRRPLTGLTRFQGRILARLRNYDANLFALLVTANIFNVFDLLFTLRALGHDAVEINPFMRMLFSLDPAAAGAVKVAIVLGASLLVWRFRRYRLPLLVGIALPLVFGLIFVYQLYGVAVTGV